MFRPIPALQRQNFERPLQSVRIVMAVDRSPNTMSAAGGEPVVANEDQSIGNAVCSGFKLHLTKKRSERRC